MTKRPRITAKQLIAALQRTGFEVIRIKGSHHFLQHSDGRTTIVPLHSGEVIGPGLLSQVLKACRMTGEDLRALL